MRRSKKVLGETNENLEASFKRFLDACGRGEKCYGSQLFELDRLKSEAYTTMNEATAICREDLAYFRGYLVTDFGVTAPSSISISAANIQSDQRLSDWLANLSFGTGHQKLQAQKRLPDIKSHLSDFVANDRERRRAARMYRLSLRWISSL